MIVKLESEDGKFIVTLVSTKDCESRIEFKEMLNNLVERLLDYETPDYNWKFPEGQIRGPHYFSAGGADPDFCRLCGHNFRHEIHKRG